MDTMNIRQHANIETPAPMNIHQYANIGTPAPKASSSSDKIRRSGKEKATITFQEWWSGEKSLTSTYARRVGWENIADWLEDKDKVCTDGQDDGNIGFKEGAKSFFKGLVGGIPKAMIKHPLITAGVAAGVATLIAFTGGAAALPLWYLGAAVVAGNATASMVKAAIADTDGEKKAALEGVGTSVAAATTLGVRYDTTVKMAQEAGVKTDDSILQVMKSSAEISGRNAKANYITWKTGEIQPFSNKMRALDQHIARIKENLLRDELMAYEIEHEYWH